MIGRTRCGRGWRDHGWRGDVGYAKHVSLRRSRVARVSSLGGLIGCYLSICELVVATSCYHVTLYGGAV